MLVLNNIPFVHAHAHLQYLSSALPGVWIDSFSLQYGHSISYRSPWALYKIQLILNLMPCWQMRLFVLELCSPWLWAHRMMFVVCWVIFRTLNGYNWMMLHLSTQEVMWALYVSSLLNWTPLFVLESGHQELMGYDGLDYNIHKIHGDELVSRLVWHLM